MTFSGRARRRDRGFTLVELLLIAAIVAIVAAIATPLYVNWRATALNAEAVRVVEQVIATARVDAKRTASTFSITLRDGDRSIQGAFGVVRIPHQGMIVVSEPVVFSFSGALGVQEPFALEEFDVRTGSGRFERTSTVSVIPPLGKTVVGRR